MLLYITGGGNACRLREQTCTNVPGHQGQRRFEY